MTATETYYKNRIQDLEEQLAAVMVERDFFEDALCRWEINAKDVGWKPEEGGSATWLRAMARNINDIPFMQQVIRDLSDSVERLSRALTEANGKAKPTEADIETAQAVARRTPRFT